MLSPRQGEEAALATHGSEGVKKFESVMLSGEDIEREEAALPEAVVRFIMDGGRQRQASEHLTRPGIPLVLPQRLKSLCDNPSLRVIPRSRRRRGISHCLENTQSEIPRSARNDSLGRVITQTP